MAREPTKILSGNLEDIKGDPGKRVVYKSRKTQNAINKCQGAIFILISLIYSDLSNQWARHSSRGTGNTADKKPSLMKFAF